jgi:hypothetical protein
MKILDLQRGISLVKGDDTSKSCGCKDQKLNESEKLHCHRFRVVAGMMEVLDLGKGNSRRRRQAEVRRDEWEQNEGQGLGDVGEKVVEGARVKECEVLEEVEEKEEEEQIE